MFERDVPGDLMQVAHLRGVEGRFNEGFGGRVAISRETILAGAYFSSRVHRFEGETYRRGFLDHAVLSRGATGLVGVWRQVTMSLSSGLMV